MAGLVEVNGIEDAAEVRRSGGAFEVAVIDEERRRRAGADAPGLVGIALDRGTRRPGADAPDEGGAIEPQRVSDRQQVRAGRGQLCPRRLTLVEGVVHVPE